MPVIQAADIPILSVLYKAGKLAPAPAGTKLPPTLSGPRTIPPPCKSLNDRVGLIRGDITALGVDAVVNAANRSLLGGGGVDGAIHRAAGRELKDECRSLGGCATGSAKITGAYNLPCKKVIHAVGPVFDAMRPDISETHLSGCYRTSLALAVENDCRTVAFSAISTGVYGYPSNEAAPVALGTIRRFLEQEDAEGKIEKVVLVTFENKDVQAYNKSIPYVLDPNSATRSLRLGCTNLADVDDDALPDCTSPPWPMLPNRQRPRPRARRPSLMKPSKRPRRGR